MLHNVSESCWIPPRAFSLVFMFNGTGVIHHLSSRFPPPPENKSDFDK